MSADTKTPESHGLGFYAGILMALFVLTVLTFYTARHMHTGVLHTPLAITIATIKGFLVVWFFMHLKDHGSTNAAFFVTCLFFVLLLIGLVVADVWARPPAVNPNFPAYKEMKGPW